MTTSGPLPDFIVIGAMKCGTTTLAAQLAAQAGVFMSTPKEPNYFSDDAVFAQGQGWYEGLFAQAPPGALKGEASTHYTKLPTHPETLARMTALLAAPKLVYMIRNPVARAVSHYIHDWSLRVVGDDAEAAFRSRTEFVDYGCYGMQIAPFIEAYGRGAVLLTCLEAFQTDPVAEFARVAAHLGLPEGVAWQEGLDAQNVSGARFRRLPFQSVLVDSRAARALRRGLVPKALREKIRARRQMTARPEIPADLEARMQARFLEDRAGLAQVFPGHPALDLCYPFRPA
ncbi:sulfotransferase domain-containing protein [uncultured Roseobacter sp.]|uniref:sulfotransferase domain-containing protein n=1 Tax=uncultured Roseobacter sp. TaxID=114847 RepID=UPI00261D9639|nr:sulfotransferase domain-containing protein [uncultured Roseobacter sp.]